MLCRLKSIVIISYEYFHNLALAILYAIIVTQVSHASWKFMLFVFFLSNLAFYAFIFISLVNSCLLF